MPLLGDHSKLIEGLREKSNDVRMKRLSNGLQDQLIEEYLEEQRKNVQEKARDHREVTILIIVTPNSDKSYDKVLAEPIPIESKV